MRCSRVWSLYVRWYLFKNFALLMLSNEVGILFLLCNNNKHSFCKFSALWPLSSITTSLWRTPVNHFTLPLPYGGLQWIILHYHFPMEDSSESFYITTSLWRTPVNYFCYGCLSTVYWEFFASGKFWRKWRLEGGLNFHWVLFSLFQEQSMKTYSRVYFSLCLFLAISGRSRT